MKTVGVVGLGDMGSGLAKNLLKHGYRVQGADLLPIAKTHFVQWADSFVIAPPMSGAGLMRSLLWS